jgi:hypothetical protein
LSFWSGLAQEVLDRAEASEWAATCGEPTDDCD